MSKVTKNDLFLKKDAIIDEWLDWAWLGVGNPADLKFKYEISFDEEWDDLNKTPELLVDYMRNPTHIHFFVKYVLRVDLAPYQCAILQMMWTKSLPLLIATRGGGKSFMLAIYTICRAMLHQGAKIVVVSRGFRQALNIFNYVKTIYDNAPILQDICGGTGKKASSPSKGVQEATWSPGNSRVRWLPLGDGETIRGERANYIIIDEIAAVPKDILETVVRGFAAVKSFDTFNSMKNEAKKEVLQKLGLVKEVEQLEKTNTIGTVTTMLDSNQILMAGTAYYSFNHLYDYYNKYRAIITSGGSKKILKQMFPDMDLKESKIDSSDYCVIRIPYDVIPEGIMDRKIVDQGKITMDPMIFNMEYNTIFPRDSEGFYLASWINRCTSPCQSKYGEVALNAKLSGDLDAEYIMGIDPASEDDNFAICIQEINPDYNGIVYVWTTNRREFEKMRREENFLNPDIKDYNTFVMLHIRDLMRRFNIKLIVLDSGGGGRSLAELFKDPSKMIDGADKPILDMDDSLNRDQDGLRILKIVEFSNYGWYQEAHYNLRNMLNAQTIIFPELDLAELAKSSYVNDRIGKEFLDTLDDVYSEIEELKQEMTLIQHSQTPRGNEKWDIPKITGIDADMAKKKLKKDRFTAAMLAAWGRRFLDNLSDFNYQSDRVLGGSATSLRGQNQRITGMRWCGDGVKNMLNANKYNKIDNAAARVISTRRNGGRIAY